MNLVVDIGNTLTKYGVFKGTKLIFTGRKNRLGKTEIKVILKKFPEIDACIVSSVTKSGLKGLSIPLKASRIITLGPKTKLPFINAYESPETLGADRIATSAGALIDFSGKNVLIIDLGTCIKYNVLNAKREFLGGAISPGVNIRFKSMHNYTGKLPLVQRAETTSVLGKNTKESLLSGVMEGIHEEIQGMMKRYEALFPQLQVIMTGGDVEIFAKRLKNRIFARPELLLEGLNHILENNLH